MGRSIKFEDLDLDMIERLLASDDIRHRIKNKWPLISPHDYSEWLKFEGKYIRFELVQAIYDFAA